MKISDYLNESLDSNYENIINEKSEMIFEKLITLRGKAYPKSSNVVIMAGGGGSGKGFVVNNLLGLEGKTFDVDALKSLAIRSKKIGKRVKKEFDLELSELDLKNSDDVGTLHDIIGNELKLTSRYKSAAFMSILTAAEDRKPNIIFDVTLKDVAKLDSIARDVKKLGYKKENIHIVWVINDVSVAMEQNKNRSRVVPQDILLSAHRGVAMTMNDLVNGTIDINKYMDGDIWFVFNKKGVDTTIQKSKNGGMSLTDAELVKIKSSNSKIDKEKLTDNLIKKIISYVPNNELKFK